MPQRSYLFNAFNHSFRILFNGYSWILCALPVVAGDILGDLFPQPHLFDFWGALVLVFVEVLALAFLFQWSFCSLYLLLSPAHPHSALQALTLSLKTSKRWYAAYCLSLVPILLGSLLVLPGIYFVVVFAFVTLLALQPEGFSLFDTLSISKQLIAQDFWRLFPIFFFIEFIMVVLGFELQDILQFIRIKVEVPTLVQVLASAFNILFRVWSYIFYCLVFFSLWRNHEQTHLRDSGKSSPN